MPLCQGNDLSCIDRNKGKSSDFLLSKDVSVHQERRNINQHQIDHFSKFQYTDDSTGPKDVTSRNAFPSLSASRLHITLQEADREGRV